MLDQLRAMAVFAKTVEAGSFRGAARAFGLSPSVVSHHVSQLEARLGVALLYRSTRRLTLTSDGDKLFTAARTMVAAAEDGLDLMASRSREPTGHLSVTAPAVLMSGPLVDDLAVFARHFPKVSLSINFSDTPLDLIREGIDVAIRMGFLKDSSLKSKKLLDVERKLVAAPAYVAANRMPLKPKDLLGWDWIRLKSRPPRASFISHAGRRQQIEFSPRIVVDSAQSLLQLARHGLGLVMVPTFVAEPDLRRGTMVEVLSSWRLDAPGVYAVWPHNAPRSGLTMRFVAFLESRISRRSGRSS
jgi:DNA-binding transcriptional LysR family regulator